MMNVTKEQLHKCIFVSLMDFKDIANKIKPGVSVIYREHKILLETDGKNNIEKQEILQELSMYFNVNVTGFHADDSDDTGVWIQYKDNVAAKQVPCGMCFNSRFDDDLTDENDFASYAIGCSDKNYRMMYSSGYGKPPRIEFETWSEENKQWITVGVYSPKCCPECGREITEYNKNQKTEE